MLEKKEKRIKRHKKIRAKIWGSAKKPRLCVFRSAKHIYAQLIDDEKGKTIAAASDLELKKVKDNRAKKVGELIAKKAKDNKIEKVIFDRAGYLYHGQIKSLAEGAREEGLKF